MGPYFKKFENHSQYVAFTGTTDFILPNVSICVNEGDVHYNPSTPPTPVETRLVCKYNVTDTSNPTKIGYNQYISGFSAIEIDGVEQAEVVSAYTFSTTGEHTVKYTLTDSTTIIRNAFFKCSDLTSIDIPIGITSIGIYAFQDCSGLTSIDIPSGVTSIGKSAFGNCTSLTSVTIPNSVTSIGNLAFDNTPWWTSYSADASHHYGNVIYINDVAYQATATTITSAELKDSTVGIGNSAFNGCSGLTSIDIPNSVTSIGNQAFYWCTSLISVTVNATTPPTLELDSHAFTNNEIGRKIYVPSTSVEVYKAAEGWSDYASDIEPIS